jgi:xanthine dehydrogenase YagR molybdenum-binding subunit
MNKAAPDPGPNMGEPVARIEGRLKVTGAAPYPADIPLRNVAHGVLAISSIARGGIRKLHLEEARAVQGVIDIFTHEDVGETLEKPKFGSSSTSIAPLGDTKIWHDGQIMALVVAESFEVASEAASLVRAEYDEEKPSAGFDADGTETVPAAGASPMYSKDVGAGDFEGAYGQAEVKIDQRYSTPTQHHNPIELFSTSAAWQGDELLVNEPSQNVTGWKNELARQMRLDAARVRLVSPFIGGAFGSKGPMTPRTAIVALAARRLGRPVRCVVSRMQA